MTAPAPEPAPGPPPGPVAGPVRVLLVDDQVLFRAGLAVIVDAQPDLVVVGQAGTGREALAAADRLAPDVVVMDVRMPDLDGAEATRELLAPQRAAARARPLRVLVLTTFALDERAVAALRWGASAFLLKDVAPDMLCAAVRTVHAGHAVMAPHDLARLAADATATSTARDRPPPASYSQLTDKEREVFAAVASGLSNAEIAGRLYLSESTVKTHVGSLLRKLGLRDRVHVVLFAHEHGLLDGPGR